MHASIRAMLAALVLAPIAAAAAPSDPAPRAAAWLALIDGGRYADSWTASGAIFRARVSKTGWAAMAAQVRIPLGSVVKRTFVGDEPSNALPGAPDGSYDTVHFSTIFTHKRSAVETVVMARESGGWRVDGYFIR
ncbi:MAG TPA: DUF4019 domain-containing protein [Caulobacteraceae bacterium]